MKNSKTHEINYLYFGFFFVTVSCFTLLHLLRQENFWERANLFFLVYALDQALVETWFFTLLACVFNKTKTKYFFYSFIGFSFVILLAHYTNFTLLRLMDTSFSYLFQFFFGSGLEHCYTGFLALNMNQTMIFCIVSAIILVPFIGIGLYRLTQKATAKRKWLVSTQVLYKTFAILGIFLFFLDLFAYFWLDPKTHKKYEKMVPLGIMFLSPTPFYQKLSHPIAALPKEEDLTREIDQLLPAKEHLPNIYFFIIETLRPDFINEKTAPAFTQFKKQNISFPSTFANANYSNLSWFSLLHALYPHKWTQVRDSYREGSVPLRILQKLGYKIRVYSSADLKYFMMQKVLFGVQNQRIDHLVQYTDLRSLEPCDRDALALKDFAQDVEQKKEGTLYLFFLDSTHSEYSFPKDFRLEFEPISDKISYLTIHRSHKDIILLKNRYRNAIHYVDTLLQQFFSILKEKKLYDEAIIALTGDHAEEFFEEGSLFHGTHLNHYQTAVPIAFKIQDNSWKSHIDPFKTKCSHVDIFPSIIHYLSKSLKHAHLFDGQSIFAPDRHPYLVSFLQNGSNPPAEFCLEWDKNTIKARFASPDQLEILESSNAAKDWIDYHIHQVFSSERAKEDLWQKGEKLKGEGAEIREEKVKFFPE